jgi:hypothetical protein
MHLLDIYGTAIIIMVVAVITITGCFRFHSSSVDRRIFDSAYFANLQHTLQQHLSICNDLLGFLCLFTATHHLAPWTYGRTVEKRHICITSYIRRASGYVGYVFSDT